LPHEHTWSQWDNNRHELPGGAFLLAVRSFLLAYFLVLIISLSLKTTGRETAAGSRFFHCFFQYRHLIALPLLRRVALREEGKKREKRAFIPPGWIEQRAHTLPDSSHYMIRNFPRVPSVDADGSDRTSPATSERRLAPVLGLLRWIPGQFIAVDGGGLSPNGRGDRSERKKGILLLGPRQLAHRERQTPHLKTGGRRGGGGVISKR